VVAIQDEAGSRAGRTVLSWAATTAQRSSAGYRAVKRHRKSFPGICVAVGFGCSSALRYSWLGLHHLVNLLILFLFAKYATWKVTTGPEYLGVCDRGDDLAAYDLQRLDAIHVRNDTDHRLYAHVR
jgi:hypothetical protein